MIKKARIYDFVLKNHLLKNRQMAFVSGPRQVGKTTECLGQAELCLNWDKAADRALIVKGPEAVVEKLNLSLARPAAPVLLLDELHKYARWKTWLKGFFDSYESRVKILVTGSSRLDVYRRGGDSMMGRYFLYHMHPFSVAELANAEAQPGLYSAPRPVSEEDFQALWQHGGFPEPLFRRDAAFSQQWQQLRRRLMIREDLRDISRLHEFSLMEVLLDLLDARSSQQLSYKSLAESVQASPQTVKRWVDLLQQMHHGFLIRPWYRQLGRSLRKEPKWHLRDWSGIEDPGAKAETFVACHLLKAADFWTDTGQGSFELRYLRDFEKREVDLLLLRDAKPWLLVEVKKSDTSLHPPLAWYQQKLGAPHAIQVVLDLSWADVDAFAHEGKPVIVPARSFLSQLV